MYPAKVFHKNSKANIEDKKSVQVFTSNKSLGLGNLFLSAVLNENYTAFDSHDETQLSSDSLQTTADSSDESSESEYADSENSDESEISDEKIKPKSLNRMRDKLSLETKCRKGIKQHDESIDAENATLSEFMHHLQQNESCSVVSKDSFFSDLRSLLSLSSNEENNKSNKNYTSERSIFEIVDIDDCWSAWNYNNQSNKVLLAEAIDQSLYDHPTHNTVRVNFGKLHFNCHRMVLRYAKLFQNWERKPFTFETAQNVTAIAFTHFYQFAMGVKPTNIAAKYFLDVLKIADVLDVTELHLHCMALLDSQLYQEQAAFEIYKVAKEQLNLSMQRLMLQRIWKFFLPLVATKYFIDMDVDDVCRFLKADTIGVNSEIEIFYAAVLWLNTKWKKRKGKILERVMSCVRYGLLPPWFTYSLKRGTGVLEVDRILECKFVEKMIEDGAAIAATIGLYFMEPPKFESILQRLLPKVPRQRKWVFDKNCTYHYGAHEKVSEAVDYIVFKDYLKMLQMEGQNYWQYIKEAKDDHLVQIFCQKFSDSAWSKMKF